MKPTRIAIGIAAAIALVAIVSLLSGLCRALLGIGNSDDASQVALGAQIYRMRRARRHDIFARVG